MRATIVICGLLGCVLAGDAIGETRTTTAVVIVRKAPGEKARALVTLPAGTPVEVVREDGRWLRIRIKKIEGYVTRTTVSEPVAKRATTAVWSAPRRHEGVAVTDLFVEVTAPSALLRSAPKDDAPGVAELARGGRLSVIDAATDPAWIHGRDEQGHDGWIARAEVDNGAASVAVTGVDLRTGAAVDELTRPTPRRVAIRTELGIGFRSLGMDLTSNAEGGLTNYLVDADAVALTLDTTTVLRMFGSWFVAVDARVQLSDASPGIDYLGPTSPAGKIPFRTFATDVGVRAGLRAKQVFDLSLRAGGHYDAFLPRDVDNAGMLPREQLLGLTLGASAEIVPKHSPFSATIRGDILAIGARAQTPGLEDGTSNTTRGVWAGATVRYLLGQRWAVFGGYEFGRATTSWTGMSVRQPGVTSARRVDTTQLLQVGMSAEI
jgi:SH3-like domain-containing protein